MKGRLMLELWDPELGSHTNFPAEFRQFCDTMRELRKIARSLVRHGFNPAHIYFQTRDGQRRFQVFPQSTSIAA